MMLSIQHLLLMLFHSYCTKLFPDIGLMSLVAEVTNQFVRNDRELLHLKPKSIHFNQHQCAVYFSLCSENFIDICSIFIFSLKEPGDLLNLYMEDFALFMSYQIAIFHGC